MFLQKRNCELPEEMKDIALGLITMLKKSLIEIINFLPPEHSEALLTYVFDKSTSLILSNEKTTNLMPVSPYLPPRMCARNSLRNNCSTTPKKGHCPS